VKQNALLETLVFLSVIIVATAAMQSVRNFDDCIHGLLVPLTFLIYRMTKSPEPVKYLENKTFEKKMFHIKVGVQQMHQWLFDLECKYRGALRKKSTSKF